MKDQHIKHIAVIDPATSHPELDSFNLLARISPLPLTYHLPCLFGMDSLRLSEKSIVAIVIMGSGASVHEELNWQSDLMAWISSILESSDQSGKRIPMLGLCYGHQALAHLLGGKIDFIYEDRKKLQGKRNIDLKKGEFWGDATSGPVIVSHRETVTSLGPECIITATSDTIAIEGFHHPKKLVWGFQAHPEAGLGFLANQKITIDDPHQNIRFGHALMKSFLDWTASYVAGQATD